MEPLARDRNFTRVQITNARDLTIPQTASLLVRGGSYFQKGAIIGDTDTLVPGGLRFRGNHLQVQEFNGWVTLIGVPAGTGVANEIVTFDETGEGLQGSGIELIDQNMFGLESIQTSVVESPPAQRLLVNSGGLPMLFPGTTASPNQVLANDGSGNLFWSNNAATNEMTFNAPWIPDRLIRMSGTTGAVERLNIASTSTGGLTGISDLQVADTTLSTAASTTTFSTSSSDLNISTPGGSNIILDDVIWPDSTVGLNRYGILRRGALANTLEYADLFPTSSTTSADTWVSNRLMRNTANVGQVEPTDVTVTGASGGTVLTAPTLVSTTFTDGTLTIGGGDLTTTGGITAGTLAASSITDGSVVISASTITGVSNLSISGAFSSNTLSTTSNAIVGGNATVTGVMNSASVTTTSIRNGVGPQLTWPSAAGASGDVMMVNGTNTFSLQPIPSIPIAESGTYIPTVGYLQNTFSSNSPGLHHWMRVGSQVQVSGFVETGASSEIGLTHPFSIDITVPFSYSPSSGGVHGVVTAWSAQADDFIRTVGTCQTSSNTGRIAIELQSFSQEIPPDPFNRIIFSYTFMYTTSA